MEFELVEEVSGDRGLGEGGRINGLNVIKEAKHRCCEDC